MMNISIWTVLRVSVISIDGIRVKIKQATVFTVACFCRAVKLLTRSVEAIYNKGGTSVFAAKRSAA